MSSLRLCGKGAVKDSELDHLRQHPIEARLDALDRKQQRNGNGRYIEATAELELHNERYQPHKHSTTKPYLDANQLGNGATSSLDLLRIQGQKRHVLGLGATTNPNPNPKFSEKILTWS